MNCWKLSSKKFFQEYLSISRWTGGFAGAAFSLRSGKGQPYIFYKYVNYIFYKYVNYVLYFLM